MSVIEKATISQLAPDETADASVLVAAAEYRSSDPAKLKSHL